MTARSIEWQLSFRCTRRSESRLARGGEGGSGGGVVAKTGRALRGSGELTRPGATEFRLAPGAAAGLGVPRPTRDRGRR